MEKRQKTGAFLKQLRKENNMTQEQLGERIGVTNKTVSRWETGNYMPSVECLELLSDIYQISINVKNIAVFVMVIAMGFISNTLNIVAVAAKKESNG